MSEYSEIISLVKNGRGVYCLDPSIGCRSGMAQPGGCYGDCYAASAARRYGHDFAKTVFRHFESEKHKRQITLAISRIKLPFVRMGCSGDPSEDWEHTLEICKAIRGCNKQIVIITRHWTLLTDRQLKTLTGNICVNTSVSALDDPEIMSRSAQQYHRLKPFCKSVLRIVSCDFNTENETGRRLAEVQRRLFKNESTLDTVFRPSKNNRFVTEGIINVKMSKFLGQKCLVSKFNKKTYFGRCETCLEMCGAQIKSEHKTTVVDQLLLFNRKMM